VSQYLLVEAEIDAHSKEKHNYYSLARHQTAVGRAIHSMKQLIFPFLVHETHSRHSFVCFYFRLTEVMTNVESSE
jgi:hypothetical protein